MIEVQPSNTYNDSAGTRLIVQRLVVRDRQRQVHSAQVDIVVVVHRHARTRRRQLAKVPIFLQTDHRRDASDEKQDIGHQPFGMHFLFNRNERLDKTRVHDILSEDDHSR